MPLDCSTLTKANTALIFNLEGTTDKQHLLSPVKTHGAANGEDFKVDVTSDEFRQGVLALGKLLDIPETTDLNLFTGAIRRLVEERLSEKALKQASVQESSEKSSLPLTEANFPLGFDSKGVSLLLLRSWQPTDCLSSLL